MPTPFSSPAGCITPPTEIETSVIKNVGLQARLCTLRIDCVANLGIAATNSTLAPDACNSAICESLVGVGDFVTRSTCYEFVPVLAEHVTHASRIVITEIIILIEEGNFRILDRLQRILCVNLTFGPIIRLSTHGPWILFVVAPLAGTRSHEQLRRLLVVQIGRNRRVGRCA